MFFLLHSIARCAYFYNGNNTVSVYTTTNKEYTLEFNHIYFLDEKPYADVTVQCGSDSQTFYSGSYSPGAMHIRTSGCTMTIEGGSYSETIVVTDIKNSYSDCESPAVIMGDYSASGSSWDCVYTSAKKIYTDSSFSRAADADGYAASKSTTYSSSYNYYYYGVLQFKPSSSQSFKTSTSSNTYTIFTKKSSYRYIVFTENGIDYGSGSGSGSGTDDTDTSNATKCTTWPCVEEDPYKKVKTWMGTMEAWKYWMYLGIIGLVIFIIVVLVPFIWCCACCCHCCCYAVQPTPNKAVELQDNPSQSKTTVVTVQQGQQYQQSPQNSGYTPEMYARRQAFEMQQTMLPPEQRAQYTPEMFQRYIEYQRQHPQEY
ncbi:hypothetical protein TVAG_249910 [Trichomonas vaginalis G3]|uniref:Uncharacterized protein n=1 Tax=Trichomonas vaginalis (strain ATCC PRA-98 / G3) TaxID=412133 RepID=A2DCJ4_TRIV3|nr:hypothetical protein TVAGG3_0956480 [Trichomonas vaginalis G3]EAY21931.1 hypothetical protein TVAG_249910 [Trichomonas vaginalis G3]KAI5487594.1 hypothetical protein TVAGG3_0956480 [Trichomonas vaginalis G3]|eukprot:XP_001582917.1 hypothetical protein [Trichomonas vaginalis G3]